MTRKDFSKEELLKIVERQEKIIANYEAVSGLYKKVKKLPLIGNSARVLAGILKSGSGKVTKVFNNIKSENPDLIGICNPHFARGVRSATYSLTDDVLEVSEIFSRSKAKKIAKQIAGYKPKKVIISGHSIGYDLLVEEIKKANNKIKIYVYMHSSFIWFDVYPAENQVFENFLEFQRNGAIEKIGFCKRDLAEYFKGKGFNTCFVMNRFELAEMKNKKLSKGKIKVGIWGANWWHRNLLNQAVAALMIPNTEVHVNEIGDHSFIDRQRIVVHGFMPKDEYDKIASQMDVNMYISFTDCFPMTLIESMENGIPCLASDTSDVYAFNKNLKTQLVVSTIDGPLGIAKKLREVINNYTAIQKEMNDYLPILREEIEKSVKTFLT